MSGLRGASLEAEASGRASLQSTRVHRDFLSEFCVELNVFVSTRMLKGQTKKYFGVRLLYPSLVPQCLNHSNSEDSLGKQSRMFPISGPKGTPPRSLSLKPVQETEREGKLEESGKPVLNNNRSPPSNNSSGSQSTFTDILTVNGESGEEGTGQLALAPPFQIGPLEITKPVSSGAGNASFLTLTSLPQLPPLELFFGR